MGGVSGAEYRAESDWRCPVNFSGALRVAARGSALPVSYRKHGSANGNRTCMTTVLPRSERCQLIPNRSLCAVATPPRALRIPGVVSRWSPGSRRDGPDRAVSGGDSAAAVPLLALCECALWAQESPPGKWAVWEAPNAPRSEACLHIWRPHNIEIPMPPQIMV